MKNDLKYIEKRVIPVLKRNDVEFAAVFGSYARGEAKEQSDIDFLIRFSVPKSLLDSIGLEQELSDVLGKKVDVVSEKYIHPYIKPNITKDLKVLYGKRRYI